MSVSQEQKISRTSSLSDKSEVGEQKQQQLQPTTDNKILYKSLKKNKKSRLTFTKLKYEGVIYQVGQNICVKADHRSDYVAKLVKIVNLIDDNEECHPLIKVRWYYRKYELGNIPKEQMDCISDNEVFKTNEYDFIDIESVVSLASILNYQEFDQLESMNDTTFFCRAAFINKAFQPPMEQWEKTCICRRPPNPDLKYILCDACQIWCHLKCVEITKDKAEKLQQYLCPNCQQ